MTNRATRRVGGALVLVAVVATGLLLAGWLHFRHSLLSRAVDQGACAGAERVVLAPPTPPGSRELFRAAAACRGQVVAMLRGAPDYTCRSNRAVTACEHPLNAAGDSTYVRAVIGRSGIERDLILLETIPT